MNQRKAYNAKFGFFTKPLGPGHYDPTNDLTKPKKHGPGWAATRSEQRADSVPRSLAAQPGPGQYSNQIETIQMKQIKNVIKAES